MARRIGGIAVTMAAGLWLAIHAAAAEVPTRIAILPLGPSERVRALADILTGELTPDARFHLLERAQIDKALTEQALAAGSLSSGSNRVAIGKALQADGLCFIQEEPSRDRLLVSLTESRCGFQVASFPYPADGALADLATRAHVDLAAVLQKLRLDPSQHKLVSILRVGNATLSPDCFWIEDDLPQALGQFMASDPRILVLERRQLTSLLDEQGFSGEAITAFNAAGIIVDGEVALVTGKPFEGKAAPVTFTVRLLRPDLRQVDEVRETGTLDRLNTLTAAVAAKTLARILQTDATATNTTTAAEATLFLDMARKQGLLWAAETARALDTSDTNAVRVLVNQLTKEGFPEPKAWTPTAQVLEQARKLRRAADLCAASADPVARKAFTLGHARRPSDFLTSPRSFETEEIREMLLPVRRIARQAEEAANLDTFPYWIVMACAGFFDNIEDRLSYLKAIITRIASDQAMPERVKAIRLHRIFEHPMNWGTDTVFPSRTRATQAFYSDLSTLSNKVVRFYAYRRLADVLPDNAWRYRQLAFEAGTHILEDEEARQGAGTGFRSIYHELLLLSQTDPNTMSRLLLVSIPTKCSIYDVNTLTAFAGKETFGQLPPEDQITVYDRILGSGTYCPDDTRRMIEDRRAALPSATAPGNRPPPPQSPDAQVSRLLFATSSKAFHDAIAAAASEWAYDHAGAMPTMAPYALLEDSDNQLWIALFGYRMDRAAVGMVRVDSATLAMTACHVFATEGASPEPPTAVLSTRTLILVAVPGVGLVHFPRKDGSTVAVDGEQGVVGPRSGLMDPDLVDAMEINASIYVAGAQSLTRWVPSTGECEALLNLRDRSLSSAFDREKLIMGLATDTTQQNLCVIMRDPSPNSAARCYRVDVLRASLATPQWACAVTNMPLPDEPDKTWTNIPALLPAPRGYRAGVAEYHFICPISRPVTTSPSTAAVVATYEVDSGRWTNLSGAGQPAVIVDVNPRVPRTIVGEHSAYRINPDGSVVAEQRTAAVPPLPGGPR